MTPTRILIVDDSPTVRRRVQQIFARADSANFEVIEATDGGEALKLLEQTSLDRLPDLILLDRNMPNVSGDACIRLLKSDPVWKTIPVIFLTAQADKAEVVKGLSLLGCNDYLSKPFDTGEMLARVQALVRVKQAEDANRKLTHDLTLALEARDEALEIISSSIRYASRIQRSVLPDISLFEQTFSQFFILWEPRDTVGGDIYWCDRWGDGVLLILGDCTGHGVPGAFMTLIVSGAMARAQSDVPVGDVAAFMQRIHHLIQVMLGQNTDSGESDDGVELGICFIHADRSVMTYAGARFALFVSNDDGTINEIKGNKKGIGYRDREKTPNYDTVEIPLLSSTRYYLTTDGLIDQIGGANRRSFGKNRFKELLLSGRELSMTEQKARIHQALLAHQGQEKRRDDVSVIGFKLA